MVRLWCFHLQSNNRKKLLLYCWNWTVGLTLCGVACVFLKWRHSRKCILFKQNLGFQLVLMHFPASFCDTAPTPLRSGVVCFTSRRAVVPWCAGSLLQLILSPFLVPSCAGSLTNRSGTASSSWLELGIVDKLPALESVCIQYLLTSSYRIYVWLLPKNFKPMCLYRMQDVLWWQTQPWESLQSQWWGAFHTCWSFSQVVSYVC